ncbi:hypothetical protein ACQR0Z_30235 [Bradyrhizobium sp. HKCCYLS3077]|uniref:hypothetical protein n=1 Tax=Bradyrhizobium sp. HKCCYLS3077 TaxID=3420761 RepID=UPI003EB9EFB6
MTSDAYDAFSEIPRILITTFTVALTLVCHIFLCAIAISSVFGIEQLIHWLWGQEDPKFFDVLPLRYVFGAVDLGLIAVFGGFGIWDAVKIFRGKK